MSNVVSGIKAIFESARGESFPVFSKDSLTEPENLRKYSAVASTETSVSAQSAKEVAPLFGKQISRLDIFGGHPDFQHLQYSGGMIELGHTTTLFVDIKNSTRLGLIYNLEEVFKIKNAIIQISIGVIQAFGGHVHRIMGDCVMGYFRSSTRRKEDTIIDSINASITIMKLMTEAVFPQLHAEVDPNAGLGVRIGLDFGNDSEVLWGNYGIGMASEITATSRYVDFASKLQSQASKNTCCIGENLRQFIGLPTEFLNHKYVEQGGIAVKEEFLLPNFTIDKRPINYQKWIINAAKYIDLSPLSDRKIPVKIDIYAEDQRTFMYRYFPCSSAVPKKCWIKFSIDTSAILHGQSITVNFSIHNYGEEAETVANNDNHNKNYSARDSIVEHWERTSYKGLHKVVVKLTASQTGHELRKESFGIFIA